MSTRKQRILAGLSIAFLALCVLVARELWIAISARPGNDPKHVIAYNERVKAMAARHGTPAPGATYEGFVRLIETIRIADKAASTEAFEYSLLYQPNPTKPVAPEDIERERLSIERARAQLTAHRESGRLDALAQVKDFAGTAKLAPTDQALFGLLLPELGSSRACARAINADARLALSEGDAERSSKRLVTLLDLSRVIAPGCAIQQLVGTAIEALAFDTIVSAHAEGTLTPGVSENILAAMLASEPLVETADMLNCERDILRDFLERTHTTGGRFLPAAAEEIAGGLTGVSIMGESASPALKNLTNIFGIRHASKGTSLKLGDAYYDTIIEHARTQRSQRPPLDEDSLVDRVKGSGLVATLVPAGSKMVASADSANATRAGILTLLAIRVYQHRTGTLPASLDDLVPSILPELPRDDFAKDGRFIYRIDPSASGGFLLYGVGVDGEDDGATPGEYLSQATSDPNARGIDLVLSGKKP